MTPSAYSESSFASSEDFIPNPASVGTRACFLISSILVLISFTSKFDAPVTPLRVT